LIGEAIHFDLNITNMPLAQRPAHHLKLLFKFTDNAKDEIWVRFDCPADITVQLLTQMLMQWHRR
jgi:hypothetical protein